MQKNVDDLLFYIGKVAERLSFIEAAAGTSGNISVRADHFPIEEFPKNGSRNIGIENRNDTDLHGGRGEIVRYRS